MMQNIYFMSYVIELLPIEIKCVVTKSCTFQPGENESEEKVSRRK